LCASAGKRGLRRSHTPQAKDKMTTSRLAMGAGGE